MQVAVAADMHQRDQGRLESGSLEWARLSVLTVAECLGVAVDDWKPGALYVHHDLMALAETMAYVRQRKLDHRPARFWCCQTAAGRHARSGRITVCQQLASVRGVC